MDREGNLGPGVLSDARAGAPPRALRPLAETYGQPWLWTRPRFLRRRYELRAGSELLAVLESRSALRSDTLAETAAGRWRMRHEGLLRGLVRVVQEGQAGDAAIFRPRWFGAGEITTRRGAVLHWRRGDFWGRRWQMVDSGGLARLTFARAPAFFSLDVRVEVAEHARADVETEPLVLLGYYLLLLIARQAHAAG
jgi:hypothetical protein